MSIEVLDGDGAPEPDVLDISRPTPVLETRQRAAKRLGARYWTLWSATAVSSFGDGLVTISLPLLAVSITRDGLALGGLLAALRLPWLVVAVPLGALSDRVDKRRMAVDIEVLRAVVLVLVGVLIATGVRSLPFLYLTAVVLGTLEAGFVAATSAAVPDLVAKEHFASANGHLAAANTAGEDFVGVGLGGLAFAVFAALPFLLDSLTFAVSALLLLSALPRAGRILRARDGEQLEPVEPAVVAIGGSGMAGLRYVAADPALRVLLFANAALAFFQAMTMGVLVAFAVTALRVTQSGYGLMLSLAALGMVGGGLLAGRIIGRLGSPVALLVAASGAAIAYFALAYAGSAPTAVVALALEGFSVIVGRTAITTLRHERVLHSLQARTNTIFRSVVYGVVPAGALLGGVVARYWSLKGAIAVAGILQLIAVGVLATPVLRRLGDRAVDIT